MADVQVISDLLKPERQNLVIREDRKRGVFVEGLSEWVVRSPAEVSPALPLLLPSVAANDSRTLNFAFSLVSLCSASVQS